MKKDFLKKIGLDDTLPDDQLLEALQDKNLEYLERIDACNDQKRLEELQDTQKQIEDMIMSLTTGITLSNRVQTKNDKEKKTVATSADGSAAPTVAYNDALAAFQRGDYQTALPVLTGYAEQGDVQACLLTAHILSEQGRDEDTKRYLFVAAKRGDDLAVFMLAQQYLRENNYIAAEKWARTLYDKQFPGSASLLANVYFLKGSIEEVIDIMLRLQGYERFEMAKRICIFIDKRFHSNPSFYRNLISDWCKKMKDDQVCCDLVHSRFDERIKQAIEDDQVKYGTTYFALIGLLCAVGSFFLSDLLKKIFEPNSFAIAFIVSGVCFAVNAIFSYKVSPKEIAHTQLALSAIVGAIGIGMVLLAGYTPSNLMVAIFLGSTWGGLVSGLIFNKSDR